MKNLLKSLTVLLTLFTIVSCSDENETVQMNEAPGAKNIENVDRVIGVEKTPGVYEITADKDEFIAEFEAILKSQGEDIKVTSLEIVEREIDESGDKGYILLANSDQGVSIGSMVQKSRVEEDALSVFILQASATSTSCWGCSKGCFLRMVRLNGQLFIYCDEGLCGNFCRKVEREK